MSEAENPDTDDALRIEQTDEKGDEPKLEEEKAFMVLNRQKHLRRSDYKNLPSHGEALYHTEGWSCH